MARCTYCGKPVGILRKHHPECHERYERAIGAIPMFFSKILTNPMPAKKFASLLINVCETSHIAPNALKAMSVAGLGAIVDQLLRQRLLSADEEQRIVELKIQLKIDDHDFSVVEDKLVKSAILRDVASGTNSNLTEIAGPMPIDLRPDEIVAWIFNRVKCFRSRPSDRNASTTQQVSQLEINARQTNNWYFPSASLNIIFVPKDAALKEGSGDLVITNYNIHFLTEGKLRTMPISKISSLNSYADGIEIKRTGTENEGRSFVLDDPWFALNLITILIRSSQIIPPAATP